jgi:O-antigen/teichoic acid export membrane protein
MTDSEADVRTAGDGTAALVTGSVVAAIAAYLFLQGGARLLGADRFAAISALWTIQFLIMAVALMPLEQLTIRLRALDSRASLWRITGVVVGVSALLAGAYAALNVDELFDGDRIYVILAALSVVTMAVFAVGRGELAGRLRYREYGFVTGGQALLRLGAGLMLVAIGDSATGGGWAMVLSPLVVLWWWRGGASRTAGRAAGAASFFGGVLVANGAAQVVLVSGPLAVERIGGSAAAVSVLFATLTLFRAPLAVANNVLARLLPPFAQLAATGDKAAIRSWSIRLPAVSMTTAFIAVGIGAWIGPDVTAFLFGSDFRPPDATAAFVAGGSILATGSSFANQILIALGTTWKLAAAWIIGLVVGGLAVWTVDAEATVRVAAGFASGEAAALIGVGLVAYRRCRP